MVKRPLGAPNFASMRMNPKEKCDDVNSTRNVHSGSRSAVSDLFQED
jgi:hypothetical protein